MAESMKDKVRNLGMKADEFEKDLFDLDDVMLNNCTATIDFSRDNLKSTIYPKLQQMKAKYGIDIPLGICGVDLGRLEGKLNNLEWDKRSDLNAFKERFNGLPGWDIKYKPGSFEYKTVNTRTEEGIRNAERLQREGWKPINAGIDTVQLERPKKGIRIFNVEKPEDVDKLPPFASLFPDLEKKEEPEIWDFPNGAPAPNNYLWDGENWVVRRRSK
jgi:hypothetical protein